MKKIIISILLSNILLFALNIGEIPKKIILSGKNGGLINGSAWDSSMIREKIYVLFYVDPDKKSDNEKFLEALEKKKYNPKKFGSIAIINLKATWLPNFAIEKKLKTKQKEFPNKIYVKDKNKFLVKNWQLADNSSNVLIFDKSGKLIYQHIGKMNNNDIKKAFSLIKKHIND